MTVQLIYPYDVISSYTTAYRTETYEKYVIYIYDCPCAIIFDDYDIKHNFGEIEI